MFYNLLNFPEAPPANRPDLLKTIIDDYQPDLFMVCELQSEQGGELILERSLETADNRYKMATYVDNQSSGADLQQLIFFNSKKFTLESQSIITTSIRDINHYVLKLKTSDAATDPVFIDAFVTHLKASQGDNNERLRLEMVLDFTEKLNQIPSDHYVLFAGDFNFYTSNEEGYQEIINPTNDIVFKDPINRPGNWHVNSSFSDIHTQSTRTSSSGFGGFGAGGGLDDRFDFIMISENLLNSSSLKYVEQSYKAYGNNGNCFNNFNINSSSCSGTYPLNIRNALYNMSDHLPVVMELQSDKVLSISNENFNKKLLTINGSNIVSNKLSLKIDVKLLNEKLIIYNTLGQKLKTIKITESHIRDTVNIEINELENGIYFLAIDKLNLPNPIKFIKAN